MIDSGGPGNKPSLAALLEELEPQIQGVLARHRVPVQDSEDLLHDAVLLYLYKRREVIDPRGWLIGALRLGCLQYWRRRRRQLYDAVDRVLLEELAGLEEPPQEAEDRRRDLDRVLAELPGRCRRLFRLRYRLECSPVETADRMGYKRSSIYKVNERCLAALAGRLIEGGWIDEPAVSA